jgi:hypothetical protein
MSEEMKAGDNQGSCGCGAGAAKCPCGSNKCCCKCIKKAICSLVLLLLGGVIGYFMGTHCCAKRMMCPMAVTTPVAEVPTQK